MLSRDNERQQADPETGLGYKWYRFYDASIRKFISADPIGLAGGVNLRLYANADPVGSIDPTGLAPCVSRRGAFRQAKRDVGIPMNQQPDKVFNERTGTMEQYNQVMMTDSHGEPVLGKGNQPIWTREYQFTRGTEVL